ncbi:PX domain-containing protein 1 isoform X3 [Entelurus aequoreus]|uniref:PX domain-containing protein 1 isoform X3 n=1 Tax=Entelurus aequoreus TaxID=161455 RepID=UPI002B1D4C81|nr:PX domain-containing protein 1 isoform X3 [Entelurus aequoreus]
MSRDVYKKTASWSPFKRRGSEQHAGLRDMASAVFEGTSLVNMFVRDCWVNGVRRLVISRRGEEEDFFEIRTEWSDRNVLYLHRSYSDLARLFRRLNESFPEDTRHLSTCPLTEGLVKIKEANDIEEKLNEVERLLKNAINMPCKIRTAVQSPRCQAGRPSQRKRQRRTVGAARQRRDTHLYVLHELGGASSCSTCTLLSTKQSCRTCYISPIFHFF